MIKITFIVLFTLGLLIYQFFSRRKNFNYSVPKEIKERYKKITVPAEKVRVKSRGYFETEEEGPFPSTIKALDAMSDKREKKVYKEVSVLIYDFTFKGIPKTLNSTPIYMPLASLHRRLKRQKVIDIYFDENDFKSVYYDLGFLEKSLESMS